MPKVSFLCLNLNCIMQTFPSLFLQGLSCFSRNSHFLFALVQANYRTVHFPTSVFFVGCFLSPSLIVKSHLCRQVTVSARMTHCCVLPVWSASFFISSICCSKKMYYIFLTSPAALISPYQRAVFSMKISKQYIEGESMSWFVLCENLI